MDSNLTNSRPAVSKLEGAMSSDEEASPRNGKAVPNNREPVSESEATLPNNAEAMDGNAEAKSDNEEENLAGVVNRSALTYSASVGFPPFVLDPEKVRTLPDMFPNLPGERIRRLTPGLIIKHGTSI